ncbi:hypothetical protein [Candidatus Albibeggiatoa sp. nov. NOAA]|uniref:hypothetical protein n=1 Tax=Candidatus Albibeggiatoa sp. nov. NOAA TaxID=3162724 RepID=UPI003303D42A|nr:hypothetical protein [Thiotrichaceae bacterium]
MEKNEFPTMDFESLFQTYETWKQFPSYSLEPRIDVFIAYYMHVSIQRKFGFTVSNVIPEFPLRCGTLYPNETDRRGHNRSFNVDFYALSTEGENLFIEVKSDSNSHNSKQEKYLQELLKFNMSEILLGIKQIYSVTSLKKKYKRLLSELKKWV